MSEVGAAQQPDTTSTQPVPNRHIGWVLAGLQLVLLLAALDQTVVSTAMPHIVAQLNGFDRYAWVTTAYLLTSTAAVPIFGKISDIYGRKWVFLAGITLFVIASALCGSAGWFPGFSGMDQLIAFRALQGIAAGNMMGLTFTLVADLFSPADRGKYQGVFAAVFAAASLIGPALGGWISDSTTWRWVFYINVPVGLLALSTLWFSLPQSLAGNRGSVDYPGLALLLLFLTPLLLALSTVVYSGWTAPPVVALLIISLVSAVAFYFCERSAPDPLIPLSLFQSTTINIASISLFVTGIGMFGSILLVPLFLQSVIGLSAASSGGLLAPLLITVALSSVGGGLVLSRYKRYKVLALVGFAAMTSGTFLLSSLTLTTSLPCIIAYMLVVGVGLGLLLPVYTIVIQNQAPEEMTGIATGLSQFFRSVGGTVGTAAFGSLMLGGYRQKVLGLCPGGLSNLKGVTCVILDNPLEPVKMKAQLAAALAQLPNQQRIIESLLSSVRESLIASIDMVFWFYALILLLTLFLNLFMPDLPLRQSVRRPQS